LKPIRIALGGMPRLLRDIVVEAIGREADMRIVGEITEGGDIEALLRESRAELLVAGDSAGAELRSRWVREHEGLKVLVLSERGESAELSWLEARKVRCVDLSTDRFVGLIRTSFAGSSAP